MAYLINEVMPGITLQTLTAWTSSNFTTGSSFSVVLANATGCEAVIVQLDQTTTITAGAVTWEGTYDGTNWATIPAAQVLDPTSASFAQIANPYTLQASTNKAFLLLLGGFQQVRARCSTTMTGTGAVTPYVTQLGYAPVSYMAISSAAAGAMADGADTTFGSKGDARNTATDSTAITAMQVLKEISYMEQNPASCAVTTVDGGNTTIGSKADAKSTATDTTAITIMQVLKEISYMAQNPASVAVTNAGTFAVQSTNAAETTKVIGTVRVQGNVGGVFDAAPLGTAPANAVQTEVAAATALPTAAANAQVVVPMADKFGRQVMVLDTVRDLIGTADLNSSSSSAVSFITAGGTGVFNDITTLVITNESSTATVVSLSDNGSGGNVHKYAIAANGGIVITYKPSLPQGTSNAAWDVLNSAAVTLDYHAVFAKNK